MNNTISKNDFLSVLNDTLSAQKEFVFTPTGDSMKPMLNGTTDTVTLVSKPKKLKKYDVVLFVRRRDNALILHRIVKVIGDSEFVLCGDNQYYFDKGITYDDIVAVVKQHTHNGKTVLSTAFSYRMYSRIILIKKYTRLLISKIYHKLFK